MRILILIRLQKFVVLEQLLADGFVDTNVLQCAVHHYCRLDVDCPVIQMLNMSLNHHFQCFVDRNIFGLVTI